MTTKTLQVITCAAIFAFGAAKASAQQALPSAQTKRLLKVAAYFHHRELAFRAKAQRILNEYSRESARYPMATKTVTHATAVSRRYHEYQAKADENARLAANYDEILRGMGFDPPSNQRPAVSLRDLQTDSTAIGN